MKDGEVLEGARAVVANAGPTYTNTLSAGELLVLLSVRALERRDRYEVPSIMGPTYDGHVGEAALAEGLEARKIAAGVLRGALATGYLPARIGSGSSSIALELALLVLSCAAIEESVPPPRKRRLTLHAIPGVTEALERVKQYAHWWRLRGVWRRPGIGSERSVVLGGLLGGRGE